MTNSSSTTPRPYCEPLRPRRQRRVHGGGCTWGEAVRGVFLAALACMLSACFDPPESETRTLLGDQLGFPVLDGLELCPSHMTIMDGARERAICAKVQGANHGSAQRILAEYAQLATSAGWSPERIDPDRAYLHRVRGQCREQLMIFIAEGPEGERFIMFAVDPSTTTMTTAIGAIEPATAPQDRGRCAR